MEELLLAIGRYCANASDYRAIGGKESIWRPVRLIHRNGVEIAVLQEAQMFAIGHPSDRGHRLAVVAADLAHLRSVSPADPNSRFIFRYDQAGGKHAMLYRFEK